MRVMPPVLGGGGVAGRALGGRASSSSRGTTGGSIACPGGPPGGKVGVLVGVHPPCCSPVCIACLAWGISVAHVPPCSTAQVPGTGVQPLRNEEVFQQASHEHTSVAPAVAEEAQDEVDAGLTLSHGPGKQCAHCLAKVLQHIGEAPLVDIRRRIHVVRAEVAMEGVVDMRVSETSAVDRADPGRWWRAVSQRWLY